MIARPLILLVAGLSFSQAVLADLTLIGRSTLVTLNMPNQGREALYVKKSLMRRDLTDRGRSYSYLYDLRKKEVTYVDHFMRQFETHGLSSDKSGNAKDMRLDLKPTGRKHALQDWNCQEYALTASLPAEMGQEKVTVTLDGQVWLERKARELKEIAPFVKKVEAADFFVGAATPGKPVNAQAEGINEVMRRVLGRGLLCAADIQLNYEGSGPMADLGRRMATKASIVYESVSDEAIKDDLFNVPAGYREMRR